MASIDVGQISLVIKDEAELSAIDKAVNRAAALQKTAADDLAKQQLEGSKKAIKNAKKLQEQANKELAAAQLEADIERVRKEAEEAATYAEKLDKERELRQLEMRKKAADDDKKLADNAVSAAGKIIDKIHSSMSEAAKEYASYVDKVQVRLLGANETAGSISDKLTKVFGASPIFQMKSVLEKVTEAVTKGINFNIEARAAMQVLGEKVAATFDAFDASLLRLIKIQQEDSTRARLGMESYLTEFLNKNFQDSSYLANNLNSSVTAALVEAESRMKADEAAAFEYTVQKVLGSMSSVGVSDSVITQLAQGIGYLASGDVDALSSNANLETLLVAAATRGGANYGDMLLNGAQATDMRAIFTGLMDLVREIADSKNAVAVNQYAKTFGLALSDISALMNMSDDVIEKIEGDMYSYTELYDRVEEQSSFLKLMSRTSAATIGENLYQNMIYNSGRAIGDNIVSYMTWQLGDMVSGLMQGIETGIDIQPFGVGTHLNLDLGDILKATNTGVWLLPGLIGMAAGIGSLDGVNLNALGEGEASALKTETKGNLLSFAQEGTAQSTESYTGSFDDSALKNSSKQFRDEQTEEQKDENYDEEKKKMEDFQKSMGETSDQLKIIVRLLNEDGIVIRGSVGTAPAVDVQDLLRSEDSAGREALGLPPVVGAL